MNYGHDASPGFVHPARNNIYNSSIASAASASTASVWSTASGSSQASDDSSIFDGNETGNASDGDICDSYLSRKGISQPSVVPAELRQNPRRSAPGLNGRGAPPSFVRQSDRKVDFVDNLVDSSTQIVDAIWPTSSSVCRREHGSKGVLPLRTFIQETLRRSRTSFSTLQVALYYLILIKSRVPSRSFVMEQFDDRAATQSLLCGRRMFLAALILASKYLQDRNYSARAWSKISGLNTQEINQNEIAFLQAVNWKLHICKDVYQKWADIVHKFTPPSGPSSPGGWPQLVSQQHEVWRHIILGLDADLSNLEALVSSTHASPKARDLSLASPRSILNIAQEVPKSVPALAPRSTAMVLEPTLTSVRAPGRMALTSSQLPTPRLTPQSTGLSTPAAGAAPSTLSRSNAMASAMSQASVFSTVQYLDRLPTPASSSPQSYCSIRRSSLANSVSTASSPESMISDSSRLSRSSSFSSASSSASATLPSRFRNTKLGNERLSRKPSFPSVPEQDCDSQRSVSPSFYTGPVGHTGDWSVNHNLAGRKRQLDDMMNDTASNAARALQELRRSRGSVEANTMNTDTPLQSNVRDMLNISYGQSGWPASMLETHHMSEYPDRKRVCCSTEASRAYNANPAFDVRGPGIWQGILN